MKKKTTRKWRYYYIEHWDMLGRGPDEHHWYYTYEKGEWRQDVMHFIQDHLIGYDYDRIGDPEMMREISEISEEGLDYIYEGRDRKYRFKLSSFEEYKKNRDLIIELVENAKNMM